MRTPMNFSLCIYVVFIACAVSLARDVARVPISEEQAAAVLVRGNNEFALELYREVCSTQGTDNAFFSPYSISTALGMTYAGANGETAQEMADVLHFTLLPGATSNSFRYLTQALNSTDLHQAESGEPFALTVANGLWVNNNFLLLDSYISEMLRYYGAAVENLDFSNDPEGAAEAINSWVAENTMDKILNLIPEGVLSDETRVVLTNAVYFKASWINPFDAEQTSDGAFFLTDESRIPVPMMTQEAHFNYGSSAGWSAVEMFYSGRNVSMLIILPDGPLEEFEQGFSSSMLGKIRENLSSRNVQLTMPSFEFTRSISLKDILGSLGMETAFTHNADFSGMTGRADLYISDVIHKAFVKVDEEGTEAAAATAVVMFNLAMPVEPVEMNINRPFLFLIQDNETGSILFMGRVMDPSLL